MSCNLRRLVVFAVSLMFVVGCGDDADDPADNDSAGPHSIPAMDSGKGDNFIGTNSREFFLYGDFDDEVPDAYHEADDPEERDEILEDELWAHLTTVGDQIEGHIEEKVQEFNEDLEGEETEYFVYFRTDSTTETDFEVDGDEVEYSFEMELVGTPYLMGLVAPEGEEPRSFDVDIDADAWGEETLEVEIEESPSRDAFPSYDKLFDDGTLEIAMHFGGDYNEERFDLETVEWLVETLVEDDWNHESVHSFEDLEYDSGPFTREIVAEGEPLEVRVSIYHAEMKEDVVDGEPVEHEGLREAVEKSMSEADIFLYSGHAGSNAGFILDYSPHYTIPAYEFDDIEMDDDYQVFVMDGCNTYRTYVDDLMANPSRDLANTDLMTTVHATPFSAGYQVIWQLLYWFTITDRAGNHFPLSWQTMVRQLNREYPDVHYGVHGVDDAPKVNPHGAEDQMCQPCSTDADCEGGGNLCLGLEEGNRCGVACTTDEGCGEGFRCAELFDGEDEFYKPRQCVPEAGTC